MAALASLRYDPAVAVTASCGSLLAMTAIDTTNARLPTFVAPANGIVFVSGRVTVTPASAASTYPAILMGILDGATVRLRSPISCGAPVVANYGVGAEWCGLVTGLTPGNSYTWDVAYGVETNVASTNISIGGPNDATGLDAWGALTCEVWDASNILAGTMYDPGTAASKSMALAAMVAMDTTNLRLTITAPASGLIKYRLRVPISGGSSPGVALLGMLEASTVVARQTAVFSHPSGNATGNILAVDASGIISVSAGSHTFDAAWAPQVAGAGGGTSAIRYGGLNDTTVANAYGGAMFAIWVA